MIKQKLSFTFAAVLLLAYAMPSEQGPACKSPYQVQGWTDWFDRDNPSGTGDWEHLSALRKANPGQICNKPSDIEAETLSGLSVAQAKEKIFKYDTTSGFICRNRDQPDRKCNDYKVRFSCPIEICKNVCWTKWYNRDRPSGTGDWETLKDLRKEHPGSICAYPQYIQAVTTDDETPAINTRENFLYYSPTKGFVCRNRDQRFGNCKDYKVRFGCYCRAKP
ncbi:cartilage intermediate layer protein 2-like [Kryptolebias marmoratus]|uniref:Cartilage intermediate layer protein 2-like n=1 Tax=Kryptolebias marmoratus TaxID=37003 RepID=A0A3Q3AZW6_KRYMA|nr:cartilage intermediate layer protein 2-like [Kryptolebias marmoratus]